jgi:hypothetical protein
MQPTLSHLSVANCPKLQDTFLHVLGSCTRDPVLQLLDVSGCVSITDQRSHHDHDHHQQQHPHHDLMGGLSFVLKAHASSLRTLDLTGLVHLTSRSFQCISCCTQLMCLSLALCHDLSDTDMAVICAGFSYLEELNLHGCVNIGDATLKSLSRHCPHLTQLSLEFCYLVTDTGFCALVRGCHWLTHLNVKACNLLTECSFEALAAVAASEIQRHHPLATLIIGACADWATIARYASMIKQAFPSALVMWT